jgi:methylated-DNA-protein-cysteine methyltransferase-like protein
MTRAGRPNSGGSPHDTDETIHAVVRQIPRGCVATYGWIAERAGLVRGARRVGRALRLLPDSSRIPWHRVVGAGGRISLPRGGAGAQRQRRLLEREGIVFRNGCIDLKRFGWERSLDESVWRFRDGPFSHEAGR